MKTLTLLLALVCLSASAQNQDKAYKHKYEYTGILVFNYSTNIIEVGVGVGDSGIGWYLSPDWIGGGVLFHPEIPDRQIVGQNGWIRVISNDTKVELDGIDWDWFEKWAWCEVIIFNREDGSLAIGPIQKNTHKYFPL